MDVEQVIEDYKNGKVCYVPPMPRTKDINRFKELQRMLRDVKKYNVEELKKFYFKE